MAIPIDFLGDLVLPQSQTAFELFEKNFDVPAQVIESGKFCNRKQNVVE
jgi:hypothetical protein